MLKDLPSQWNTLIGEHDLDAGLRAVRLGLEPPLVTSHCLLALLIERPGGLLVEVTDGTTEYKAFDDRPPRLQFHVVGTDAFAGLVDGKRR
jgi:hypothetical protein